MGRGPGRARRSARSAAATTAITLLALTAPLTGCGRIPTGTTPSADPSPTSATTPSSRDTPAASGSGVDEDTAFGFDDIASYESGVEVEISGIVAQQAGTGVTGAETTGGQIVVASVLIRNGSTALLDATTTLVTATHGPADTDAPLVTDPTGTLTHAFLGSVTPGAEVTADVGFAVPFSALSAVTVTVDLGDGAHEPVSFAGAVERDR